jgi:hypothetical protein
METTKCLFSRPRPGKPTPKKVRGFLSLPGEIRNQIYEYYFGAGFRCEIAAKGREFTKQKPQTLRLWSGLRPLDTKVFKSNSEVEEERPPTIRISRRLGRYNVVQGLQTNWMISLFALSLVCKQVHVETVAVIYQKTEFVFDAPKRTTNFLCTIPPSNLASIRKLQLHYIVYGCDQRDSDRIWQTKVRLLPLLTYHRYEKH